MEKFIVSFYYFTDCRCEELVESPNELMALAAALQKRGWYRWGEVGNGDSTRGFRIEIKRQSY